MDRNGLDLATPVLADPADSDTDAFDGGRDRQLRHVLIPSELVQVAFTLPDGELHALRADLINLSNGGCCLVLPRRLPLQSGSRGVMRRAGETAADPQPYAFVVRWLQDLGEMQELGAQFIDGD